MAIPEALERAIAATGYTLDREQSAVLEVDGIPVMVTSPNQHYVAFWIDPAGGPLTEAHAAEYARAVKYSLDQVQDHPTGKDCAICREDTPQP